MQNELHEHRMPENQPVVVGIGASAGGLEAISRLLSGVPRDSGMSFVIIQHLDPTHKSALVEILARRTSLSICEVQKDTRVEPNHIYVIPPGQYLSINGYVLKLSEPQDPRGSRMAIDYFLTSLAEDACEFAIGVVLSGTGTDGTAGLQEIKHYGGLTVVQDPHEAEHTGMPQSAIDTVHVDFVLPAEEIGSRLKRYVDFCQTHGPLSAQSAAQAEQSDLSPILDLLRKEIKHDFRRYRKNTLMRRIHRRMGLLQLDQLSDYQALLADNEKERNALRCDLLIGVTRFFRNPEAWDVLEKQAVAPMMEGERTSPIRIWSAGCATGEEAYSIAMLMLEQVGVDRRRMPFQIFATDVAEDALAVARAGLYPESIMKDVSLERLRRFFKKEPGGYRVSKQLRESVVFANQNVLAQPPFAKLDLILCRNLLIYLEREAQDRVMNVFQFALKEGGVLFQGSSESIGQTSELFVPISKKHRISRRNGLKAWPPAGSDYTANIQPLPEISSRERKLQRNQHHSAGIASAVQRQLLQHLQRGVIVVNRENRVLFAEGQADLYVQFGLGELSAELPDVMEIAREGLKAKLRSSLRKIWNGQTELTVDTRVHRDGAFHACEMQIHKMLGRPDDDPAAMVILRPMEAAAPKDQSLRTSGESMTQAEVEAKSIDAEHSLMEVEHELTITREQLNSSISDLESANEELKAANEEAMTMNEELQSSNEELETSKEELQSLNEELTTLNNQLEVNVDELKDTTNDLENLLISSDVPTVFLDTNFRIRRYTPSCSGLFHFIAGDVGRPLTDIVARFNDPDLLSDARSVLRDLHPREKQVASTDGLRRYRRRMLPYRTEDNRIQGIVITMTDVTDLLTAQEQAQRQLAENQAIYTTTPVGLTFVDTEFRYVNINQRLAEINGKPIEEHLGKTVEEILPPRLAKVVRGNYQQVLETGEGIYELEVTGKTEGTDEEHVYLVSYVPVVNESGDILGINSVVQDITERKRLELEVADREAHLRRVIDHQLGFVAVLEPSGTLVEVGNAALVAAGLQRDDVIGKKFWECYWWDDDDRVSNRIKEAVEQAVAGNIVRFDEQARIVADGHITVDFMIQAVRDADGKVTHLIPSGVDISDRAQTELDLSAAKARLDLSLEVGNVAPWNWDMQTNEVVPNPILNRVFGFDEDANPVLSEFLERIDLADRQRVSDAVDHSTKEGETYDEEYTICWPGGENRYVRARGRVFTSESGEIRDFFGVVVDITERKRQEIELADREAHLRRVINNQLGLVGVIGRDGKLLEVDDDSMQIAGLTRDDVIGKHFAECAWWTYDDAVSQRMRDSMEKAFAGESVRYDVPLYAAGLDGPDARLMIDFMIAPVFDNNGEVEYLIPSGVDISDRHAAEVALREKEELLRMALRAGRMAAWEWSPDESNWEPELYDLLGLDPTVEASPEQLFKSVHPEDLSAIQEAWRQTTERGKDYDHEFRIVRPDGEVRWLVSTGILIKGKDRHVDRIYGLNWDITEQKQRETSIRDSERRFREMANAAPAMIWVSDENHACTFLSQGWLEYTGQTEDDGMGTGWLDAIHPDDREASGSIFLTAAEQRQPFELDYRLRSFDGQYRWAIDAGKPRFDDDGRFVGYVGSVIDSHERHETQEALKKAQIAAEAANESKSAFLANMSHEIRTPMTAILGYTDLMTTLTDHPEALGHLQTIRRNGDFLLDIINDILDLSKIEADKLDIAFEHFDPAQLMEDVRSIMDVRATEGDIDLDVEYRGEIPAAIESDPKRLKQILINLVGNAIKFTKQGGVKVVVKYVDADPSATATSNAFLHFDIIDSGIGISQIQQGRLFQPFSQGDHSVNREFGGTGLGLAISHRLAAMLGGTIAVSSEEGKGSTFTVSVAVGNIPDTKMVHPAIIAEPDRDDVSAEDIRLSCHCLVVDDRRDIRFLSRKFLTDAGATVSEAEDGEVAVAAVKNTMSNGSPPDVILLDMQMPKLDGYETAKALRRMDYTGPIIALTADAMQGDMSRCIKCGCDDYLSKPIDKGIILKKVQEYVGNSS